MDRTELEQHNQRVIEEFRRRAGTVGGMYDGMTLLLLHTVGARTGQPRIIPHFAELAASSKREVPVVVIEPTIPTPTTP